MIDVWPYENYLTKQMLLPNNPVGGAISCSVAGLINALTAFNVNTARKDLALKVLSHPT